MEGHEEALDALIEACPSFLADDELHGFTQAFEEPGQPDWFVRAAAFAQHLVDLARLGRVDDLEATFGAVEEVLADGDDEAVELVRLGLIEPLQNLVSHRGAGAGPEQLETFLGSRAREAWDRSDALWADAGERVRLAGPTDEDLARLEDDKLALYFRANTRALPDGRLVGSGEVLEHEAEIVDGLRRRQRAALARWALLVLVVVAVLAIGILALG